MLYIVLCRDLTTGNWYPHCRAASVSGPHSLNVSFPRWKYARETVVWSRLSWPRGALDAWHEPRPLHCDSGAVGVGSTLGGCLWSSIWWYINVHIPECTRLHGRDMLTPLPPPQLTGTGTVTSHGDVRGCSLAADGICSDGLGRQSAPETLVFSGHWTALIRGGLSCHSLLHAAWTLPPRGDFCSQREEGRLPACPNVLQRRWAFIKSSSRFMFWTLVFPTVV